MEILGLVPYIIDARGWLFLAFLLQVNCPLLMRCYSLETNRDFLYENAVLGRRIVFFVGNICRLK